MTKSRTLMVIPALVLAATVAVAWPGPQGPHGGGAKHLHRASFGDHFAEALDLTEEQRTAAKALHEEMAAEAAPLRELHSEQWVALEALLDSGDADATEVGEQVLEMHATRQQLQALHEDFADRFGALLDPDQLEKFEQLRQKRHMFRESHGHGFRASRGHGWGHPAEPR